MDNSSEHKKDRDEVLYTRNANDLDDKNAAEKLDALLTEKDRRLLSQFEDISIPIFFWKHIDRDFYFLGSNRFAAETTGNYLRDYIGLSASRLYSEFPWVGDELARCFREKSKITREFPYRFAKAGVRFLAASFVYIAPDIVMVHTNDITEKRRMQEKLNVRLKLAEIISSVSTDLVNPKSGEFREIIEKSLRSIGEFMGADRSYLCFFKDGADNSGDMYCWQRSTCEKPDFADIVNGSEKYPDLFVRLNDLNSVYLPNSDRESGELPADERILKTNGLASILLIPVALKGRLIGILCFASSKSKIDIDEDSRAILRLLGESIANINELRKTEIALHISETLYRDLVENINEVVYSIDRRGIITYMSPSSKPISGFDPSELIGNHVLNFIHDPDAIIVGEILDKYQAGLVDPMDIEIRVRTKSGGVIWTRVSIKPVFSDGSFTALRGVLSDITGRKKAEDALKESEERYRAVWNKSPVAICLTDRDGIYHYVNPAYCELYGYSAEALVGRPFYEMIGQGYSGTAAKANHNKMFAEGRAIPLGEIEFTKADGEKIWVECTADFVRQNAIPVYLVSMNVDVTARRKMEAALRLSEEKYGIIIDNSAELIFSVEENGRVYMVNSTAAHYLGGLPGDFTGRTLFDIFPADIAERQMAIIRKVIAENSSDIREEMIVINNKKGWFKTAIYPIYDHKYGFKAAQIISQDINESKQKTIRNAARMKLLDELRNSHEINRCLQLGCDTIFEAKLFSRSVFTLHDKDRRIEFLAYRGLDPAIIEAARNAPPPDKNTRDKLIDRRFVIGHSYFVPRESGIELAKEGRYIPKHGKDGTIKSGWKDGDELFVPVIGDENRQIGWLSVDGPFDGLRPDLETILCLEEIVDVVTQHIKEIESWAKLAEERLMLAEKNIALQEVMALVEKEKIGMRNNIVEELDKSILPILNRLIKNEGSLDVKQALQLKRNLENLKNLYGNSRNSLPKLTSRESEICEMVKKGATNQQLAKAFKITIGTVKKHREAIRKKLGLQHKDINLASYLKSIQNIASSD